MMRKQLIVLTLVLMMLLALCCGAAQADGTQQIMLGGDVLTKGAHFVMAGTTWDVLRNSTNTDDTAGRLAISSDVKNRTGKKSWLQQMKEWTAAGSTTSTPTNWRQAWVCPRMKRF